MSSIFLTRKATYTLPITVSNSILTWILVQQVGDSRLLSVTVDYHQMRIGMKRDTALVCKMRMHLVIDHVIATVDCCPVCKVLRTVYQYTIQVKLIGCTLAFLLIF